MNLDKAIFRLSGIVILVSLLLSYWYSHYWLWLTALMGLNMLQSSFTGFCLPAWFLKKRGVPPGQVYN